MAGKGGRKQRDPATTVPVVASTGLVTVAAGAAGLAAGPLGVLVAPFIPVIFQAVATGLQRRHLERSQRWFEGLLEGQESPASVADEVARRAATDANAAQAIQDHMNAIGAGAADEHLPALAALAREHVLLGKPRDRFFRNATALLTELNADEGPWLRALLERATEAVEHENITVFLLRNGTRFATPGGGPPDAFTRRLEGRVQQRVKLCNVDGGYDLLELLKHHRIANEPLSGVIGSTSGFGNAMIHRASAQRLAAVMKSGGITLPTELVPMGDWREDPQ